MTKGNPDILWASYNGQSPALFCGNETVFPYRQKNSFETVIPSNQELNLDQKLQQRRNDFFANRQSRNFDNCSMSVQDNNNSALPKNTNNHTYVFKVEGVCLSDMVDLNDALTSHSKSLLQLQMPCKKNLPTESLTLTRAKTDSVVNHAAFQKAQQPLNRTKSNNNNSDITQNNIGIVRKVNNEDILLLRFGDEVVACANKCPHKGADLVCGDIENIGFGDRLIKCPWHHFTFNLDRNGRKESPKDQLDYLKLKIYDTNTDKSGAVFVEFDHFFLRMDIF